MPFRSLKQDAKRCGKEGKGGGGKKSVLNRDTGKQVLQNNPRRCVNPNQSLRNLLRHSPPPTRRLSPHRLQHPPAPGPAAAAGTSGPPRCDSRAPAAGSDACAEARPGQAAPTDHHQEPRRRYRELAAARGAAPSRAAPRRTRGWSSEAPGLSPEPGPCSPHLIHARG